MLTALAPFAQGLGRQVPKSADQIHPHHGAHHHFRHEAQDAARRTQPLSGSETAGGEVATRRFLPQAAVDFGKAAQKTIGKALRTLGRDLGGLLADMGFDPKTARGIVKGLIDPVRAALRQGDDFTAEISLVALRQDTLLTSGAYAQSTQIFAKSLEIEVNHTTGEFSVNLQSLSIEQSSAAISGGVTLDTVPQGLDIGDTGLADFLQRLFGEEAAGAEEDEPEAEVEQPATDAALLEQFDDLAHTDRSAPSTEKGEDHQGRRLHHRPALDSRFAIRSIERFENFAGQLVTRVRLDAALSLHDAAQAESDTENNALLDLQV